MRLGYIASRLTPSDLLPSARFHRWRVLWPSQTVSPAGTKCWNTWALGDFMFKPPGIAKVLPRTVYGMKAARTKDSKHLCTASSFVSIPKLTSLHHWFCMFKPSKLSKFLKRLKNAVSDMQNGFHPLGCCSFVQYLRKKCPTCKKERLMLAQLGELQKRQLQLSGICRHCPLSEAAEQPESTKAVRAVGLTIRNAEFIHVISLSLLISHSQLKVGVERESSVFPGCFYTQK